MHHYAKFLQNRSISGKDIPHFRFVNTASVILYLFGAYFDHSQKVVGGLYHCAVVMIIWKFQHFAHLA